MRNIRMMQKKDDCFFGVGDVVKIINNNGESYIVQITCIDIKKQKNELHPIMDILYLEASEERMRMKYDSVWVENINELEIVKFKSEKT